MVLPNYNCVLCPSAVEETILHLFLYCQFSISYWDAIRVQVPLHLAPSEVLHHFKTQLANCSILHGNPHHYVLVNLVHKK